MQFKDHDSLDCLIKQSEAELLLSSISLDQSGSFSVHPVKCPGVGRKKDILTDEEGNPVCADGKKICPYFASAQFTFEDYTKKVMCKAI